MAENINLLDINEMLKLLRGQYPVRRVNRSQFDHEPLNLPTEVSVVLRDYIYKQPECKRVFQDALKVLLSGSADDVFLGFAYFNECLLNESLDIAEIQIDTNILIPLLKNGICRNRNALSDRMAFYTTSCLEYITDVNERYQKEYDFSILDE